MIENDEITKLAKSAKLEFTKEAVEKIQSNLNSIINWISEIQKIDTDNILPLVNLISDEKYQIKQEKIDYTIDPRKTIEVNDDLYFKVVKVID
ncbi:Asp-tRNA(Asn)/Glu-tRNA(Gln) amidotransferase subunit GatC [Candidatus Deianiraea vastatrix]|uniref:Glutamyl-tRNA(Gln) amidotransferase subunit C n=1 Tax=Candidatus Deianiraea vastatrix TaxID=2163644 RepID=A0A5B8XFJ7_9RICK|nr:aspartyl/glutamyl-tRNA amidotransferase subunit C [Candidatus Deianiraea vastatrix]QED23154.1 Glutamyl-tRNA(Gln) amidotransferase subunit C [Candidatus Deianiraea vastatrix]